MVTRAPSIRGPHRDAHRGANRSPWRLIGRLAMPGSLSASWLAPENNCFNTNLSHNDQQSPYKPKKINNLEQVSPELNSYFSEALNEGIWRH
jgi:hypothetical protein